VLLNQLVQCARIVKASAARNALATDGASLAQKLGHGDALQTATWGNNKQRTCNVRHVPAVLQWAVEGYGGAHVLGQEQRAELAAAVHKAACDLAATRLDAMTGSFGADIAGVDAEVRRLRADLESAKARAEDAITQLQHMHTELSGVREEASRGSTALAAAHSELAEEVRWRTQLQQRLIDLKAELQVAQEEELAHMHAPGPLLLVAEDASMNETRDQVIRLPNLMSCCIRCSAERSAELTNALLCRLMKKTPTRTGFRKCLKTPSKAICGRVGAFQT
jgi:hypothetical protein